MKYVVIGDEVVIRKALPGQERAGHKYLRREQIGPGEYRYWYKLPNGKIVSSTRPPEGGAKPKMGQPIVPEKKGPPEWVVGSEGEKKAPEKKEAPKEAPKTKVEGEKGDEPVIIVHGKIESVGSGKAKDNFKKQYEKEPKVGDTVKQPGKKDYKVEEPVAEMSEQEKEEARKRFKPDPNRPERMKRLKETVMSGKGNSFAEPGFEVGKTVTIGNQRLEIVESGELGFQGKDEKGNIRRVRWSAVRGFGAAKESKESKEPAGKSELPKAEADAYDALDKIRDLRKQMKNYNFSSEKEKKEYAKKLDDTESAWNAYIDKLGIKKSIEGKVVGSLKENPNPPDEKIHSLADRLKISPHVLEAKIYGILGDVINHGKGVKPNLKELKMGIKVELEHTKHPELARYIALAHLKEIPDYYSRLKVMENEAKKVKK